MGCGFSLASFYWLVVVVVVLGAVIARMETMLMVTEEMVAAMLKGIPQDQIVKELPKKIAAIQKIREVIRSITRRGDEARQVFDATNTTLQNELKRVQDTCPHYTMDYHSDSSGDGDSYYDCSVCGAIVR